MSEALSPNETAFSVKALTAPLSEAEPCGADLDLAGDSEYMNFMAAGEGLLPATFYSEQDGKPFDRSQIDFLSQYQKIAALNKRTHDLRLIVLLAKFRILDKNLDGFTEALETLADLLETHWEEVHPKGDNGDFILRMVAVQSLDDRAPVILPMNYVPLFEHKRLGPVTYRTYLLAAGEASPRDGEDRFDLAVVKPAFEKEADLELLIKRRDQFTAIGRALDRMKSAFVANVGIVEAVAFPKLRPLVEAIRVLLDTTVSLRNPAAGSALQPSETGGLLEDEAGNPGLSPDVASFQDASAALKAIAAYYARCEPSNPALLLVRQAEQLIGKSFLDAIQVLVPDYVGDVSVQIGRAHVFNLPIQRLSDFGTIEETGSQNDDAAKSFEITTRDSSLQLMAKISAFYHHAEPSSPISFLLERARSLSGRDFLGLLQDMLPPDTLKTL